MEVCARRLALATKYVRRQCIFDCRHHEQEICGMTAYYWRVHQTIIMIRRKGLDAVKYALLSGNVYADIDLQVYL